MTFKRDEITGLKIKHNVLNQEKLSKEELESYLLSEEEEC